MIPIHYAIDTIQEYCEHFSAKVPNTAKDRWVKRLRELNPSQAVLDAAVRRCADNDLGPAWSRLRQAIAIERGIESSKRWDTSTGDSKAFEQFKEDYRRDGFSRGYPPKPISNHDERTTDPRIAAICHKVIGRILRGTTRCPPEFADHNIHAIGDKEEEWFWGEVKKEVERKRRQRHDNQEPRNNG
tara:strand:+ start:622 stop:1179 length:558 start_codon:yes stop_codon:yes gene_type:complete